MSCPIYIYTSGGLRALHVVLMLCVVCCCDCMVVLVVFSLAWGKKEQEICIIIVQLFNIFASKTY